MTREMLGRLDDESLCRRCVEAVIESIRGTPMNVRQRIYEGLTKGQQALLAFWILFSHGKDGLATFRAQVDHLATHPGFWEQLGKGARRLQFEEMSHLIDELQRLQRPGAAASQERLAELGASLQQVVMQGVHVAAAYIRSHHDDFVQMGS